MLSVAARQGPRPLLCRQHVFSYPPPPKKMCKHKLHRTSNNATPGILLVPRVNASSSAAPVAVFADLCLAPDDVAADITESLAFRWCPV